MLKLWFNVQEKITTGIFDRNSNNWSFTRIAGVRRVEVRKCTSLSALVMPPNINEGGKSYPNGSEVVSSSSSSRVLKSECRTYRRRLERYFSYTFR